jgi:hypothetical protein
MQLITIKTASITKPIFIEKEFYIYIPNTFIPDNDRYNEYFSGSFIGVKSVEIYVFNRWGEQIYESKGGIRKLSDILIVCEITDNTKQIL